MSLSFLLAYLCDLNIKHKLYFFKIKPEKTRVIASAKGIANQMPSKFNQMGKTRIPKATKTRERLDEINAEIPPLFIAV